MVRGAAGREERAEPTLVGEHAPQRAVADRAWLRLQAMLFSDSPPKTTTVRSPGASCFLL